MIFIGPSPYYCLPSPAWGIMRFLSKMFYNFSQTLVKSHTSIKYKQALRVHQCCVLQICFIKSIRSWLKSCDLKAPTVHIQEFSGPRENKLHSISHTPDTDLKDLSLLGKIGKMHLRCMPLARERGFDLLAKQISTSWPNQMKTRFHSTNCRMFLTTISDFPTLPIYNSLPWRRDYAQGNGFGV